MSPKYNPVKEINPKWKTQGSFPTLCALFLHLMVGSCTGTLHLYSLQVSFLLIIAQCSDFELRY